MKELVLALTIFGAMLNGLPAASYLKKEQQAGPTSGQVSTVEQPVVDTVASVQPQPIVQQPETPKVTPAPVGGKYDLMRLAGISDQEFEATDYIVSKESTWCHKRMNGDHRPCDQIATPTTDQVGNRAYGLCQALPASKMATEGSDYMDNPVTQLKWCHKYANSRYGGWWNAFSFWTANFWW